MKKAMTILDNLNVRVFRDMNPPLYLNLQVSRVLSHFGKSVKEGMHDTGVVVNISSAATTTGQGSNVAYCASKAALDSITRSLGRALAPSIRVVSVSPGWVLGEYAERMPPEVLEAQSEATPLRGLTTADDVAAAVSAVVGDLPLPKGTPPWWWPPTVWGGATTPVGSVGFPDFVPFGFEALARAFRGRCGRSSPGLRTWVLDVGCCRHGAVRA